MYKIVSYNQDKNYNEDFYKVLNFIKDFNEEYQYLYYHWSRWEWMFARDNLKESELSQMKFFYNNDKLEAVLLYEDEPNTYFVIYRFEESIRKEIVDYFIKSNLSHDIIIPRDEDMVKLLQECGYLNHGKFDPVSKFTLKDFEVPETPGYNIVSLARDYRLDQIHHALWRGFNHGDEIDYSEENLLSRKHMTSSPNFKKNYTYVAIKDDKYQSYSGIWYIKNTKTALIEPVATVPDHRRKGLAQACIYNSIKEVLKDGAKDIFVGSTQKFYFDIDFEEYDYAYKLSKQAQ